MKKLSKKLLALVLAGAMVFAMGITAFAADEPSTPEIIITTTSENGEGDADTTEYTWYRIFEADIAEDPTQNGAAQSEGKVAYFLTSAAAVAEIEKTGLFNVSRVGTTDKWYVELKDSATTADAIAAEIAKIDLTKFPTGTFAQTAVAGSKSSGEVAPGYYYITSTAGTKVMVQTLKKVEINEKNTFPTVEKKVAEADKKAQVGEDITYTLTVAVPETANDTIILTDTMTNGLTFKKIESVKAGETDVAYTLNPAAPAEADKTFTITFAKDDVITNQGKTIVVTYTAFINGTVWTTGPNHSNTVKLDYGNHYTSVLKRADVTTGWFYFDKVDGTTSGVKLPGAEFELQLEGTALDLVKENAPQEVYRIAVEGDTETTKKIVTSGHQILVIGLDSDLTYQLVETKAPTGYNKLETPVEIKVGSSVAKPYYGMQPDETFLGLYKIENNKGTVLPSTGGMGTTILYVAGGIIVAAAIVLLITKRRMRENC